MFQTQSTIYTSEPTIAVPSNAKPPMPPQYYLSGATESILAVAVLLRSVALLIQALGQLKERKSDTKAASR